jgi:hypothetical protein
LKSPCAALVKPARSVRAGPDLQRCRWGVQQYYSGGPTPGNQPATSVRLCSRMQCTGMRNSIRTHRGRRRRARREGAPAPVRASVAVGARERSPLAGGTLQFLQRSGTKTNGIVAMWERRMRVRFADPAALALAQASHLAQRASTCASLGHRRTERNRHGHIGLV